MINKNLEQKKFINDNNSIIILTAPPGTGKTHSLVEHIKKNMEKIEFYEEILITSFTNVSINEIKKRFFKTYQHIDKININFMTFDKFLNLNIWKYFRKQIFEEICKKYNIHLSNHPINYKISYEIKNFNKIFHYKKQKESFEFKIKELIKIYLDNGKIISCYYSDFLIFEFLKSSQGNLIKKVFKAKYKRIIVDEAQDLNFYRFKFLIELFDKKCIKLTFVGDSKQTLFAFNGSKENILDDISKKYKIKKHTFQKIWRTNNEDIKNFLKNFRNLKEEKQMNQNIEKFIYEYSINKDDFFKILNNNQDSIMIITGTNDESYNVDKYLKKNKIKNFVCYRNINSSSSENEIDFNEKDFLIKVYILSKSNNIEIINNYSGDNIEKEIEQYLLNNHNWKKWKINIFINEIHNFKINEKKIEFYFKNKFLKFWNYINENREIINDYLKLNKRSIMNVHKAKGRESNIVIISKKLLEGKMYWSKKNFSENKNILYVALSRAKKQIFIFNFELEDKYFF